MTPRERAQFYAIAFLTVGIALAFFCVMSFSDALDVGPVPGLWQFSDGLAQPVGYWCWVMVFALSGVMGAGGAVLGAISVAALPAERRRARRIALRALARGSASVEEL